MESQVHRRKGALTASRAALAFSAVPLTGTAESVAAACVDAARALLGAARLVLPPTPVARALGDESEELVPLIRFPAPGGEAELWTQPQSVSPALRAALEAQLVRIWSVQCAKAEQAGELDRMRFHLAALQQVAHTLAVVRGAEETQRLALDSVKEVFFAWWAVLYRQDAAGEHVQRIASALRGEELAASIPTSRLQGLLNGAGGGPLVPAAGDAIRAHFPADLAVIAPLDLGDEEPGLLALGPRMTGDDYDRHDLALLRALADASAIALRNADLHDQLRSQAIRDALTGCHNRRGFDERLSLEFARARRYARPLSLVLLDLDHFKRLNDVHGHAAGDHALRRVGEVLRSSFRSTDAACRIGGEEFALLFPETMKEDGLRLAERLRSLIGSLTPDELVPQAITASLGVATYPDDAGDPEALLRAADRALYGAKSGGRNRVVLA